ncbi:GtrA family protein, partial [candidate division WWE3 bacterium]|nr:GtrA family protein [candidate division WWE3 bacterium]
LRLVLKLRARDSQSFIKFLVVGVAGLVVQTALLFLLVLVYHFDPKFALLPSFLAAVFTTFSLNNVWSFKYAEIKAGADKSKKFLLFLLVNVGSYFIQRTCLVLVQTASGNSVPLTLAIGYPLGIGAGLVWNYFFYSRIIWKK